MKKPIIWIVIFLTPTILLFLLIYGVPFLTVIASSFFEWKGFSNQLKFVGTENYTNLFTKDSSFITALLNTIMWVLLQCIVHVSIGTIVAIILSRKVKLWKFFRTVIMFPNIISAAALALIFLNLYNPQFGIVNCIVRFFGTADFSQNWYFDTKTAFFAVTTSWLFYAGVITIIVLADIFSIPEACYESARLDGASPLQMDLYITIPMIRNTIGTCMILSATSKLKEFEMIYLTTNGGPGDTTLNLPLYLYKTSLIENNYGYANTMGTVLIIMGIAAVLLITKSFKIGQSDA